jgi:23S rRNA (adenine2503-C2)-methyltransferase
MTQSHDFLALEYDELHKIFEEESIPRFRLDQVCHWVYQKNVFEFEHMSSLSKELRDQLGKLFFIRMPKVLHRQISIDTTRKFLLEVQDAKTIEMVILNDDGRKTLCISSQVGCGMGCRFCATGTQKLERNLKASEIVGQFLTAQKETEKVSNIVFMGMGEPLANYDNVLKTIRILSHPKMSVFSQRRITVSTSGLVPKIRQLAEQELQITLAISLSATINSLRDEIMPINKTYPLGELRAAAMDYVDKTGRKVTFEYVLLDGVNTHKQEARGIVKFIKGIRCNVNLIPYNPYEGSPYKTPSPATVKEFRNILEAEDVPVVVRYRRGVDIDAACGQLRTKINNKEKPIPDAVS